jgi:hypothetical protein
MAGGGWLVRYRTILYPMMNVAMLLASIMRASSGEIAIGAALYVAALFALCSAPLLLLKRLNDRYALLAIFLGLYFLFFGGLDLQTVLIGPGERLAPLRPDFMSPAELAILVGAAAALLGYITGSRAGDPGNRQRPLAEWPGSSLLLVGITVWALGTVAMVYFQVFLVPTKLGYEAAKDIAGVSPALMFVVMLGHMMQPVGILILAYGYAKYGGLLWYPLILAIVLIQLAVGFVEDIKSQAMMGAALVIMARTLVTNRLPKGWIAGMLTVLVIAFPIFQAYRVEVTGERGLDRAHALQELDKVLEIVLAARDKVTTGHDRAQTFLERSNSKQNLEILFEHVGRDVGFLNGRSLVAIPMAFVPRLLVPDKEDLSVGILFGKEILKSDSGVYISISHLGELYWNFGWLGVTLGMFVCAALLGFVGTKFNLERGVSLTRVLVLLATAQPLCLGFEGTMPVAYVVWMRSMAAIGLLHLLFARQTTVIAEMQVEVRPSPPNHATDLKGGMPVATLPAPVPRFPNLMR